MRKTLFSLLLVIALALTVGRSAAETGVEGVESETVTRARALFVEGTELARAMRWGEALARFEASAKLHAHPGTRYNIGVCERALGHFTRARGAFRSALADRERLAEPLQRETQIFLDELGAVLAELTLTLSPRGARLSVDGRPLERMRDRPSAFIAGTRAAGKGEVVSKERLVIVADPGNHVLIVSRSGYGDVIRRVDLRPGERRSLELTLPRLPGELSVGANRAGAAVSVNGLDVGVAPVTLSRPPGQYRVLVRKAGFSPYSTRTKLPAGGKVELSAVLEPEPVLLTERWWFWAGVGVALVGIGVGTYYATRPDPERPAVAEGNLGWKVRVP